MSDSDKKLMTYRTEGNPAPGELLLVHGFLNTWSSELGIEDLSTPHEAETWLRSAGLWRGKQRLNTDGHHQVLEYRELIRSCVRHQDQMWQLSKAVVHIKYQLDLVDARLQLVPKSKVECDNMLGRLSAIIYNSIIDGTWVRFKCCDLPTCGWAYYDKTRSRTKRWCSMKTCGSRHKAREYYRRIR